MAPVGPEWPNRETEQDARRCPLQCPVPADGPPGPCLGGWAWSGWRDAVAAALKGPASRPGRWPRGRRCPARAEPDPAEARRRVQPDRGLRRHECGRGPRHRPARTDGSALHRLPPRGQGLCRHKGRTKALLRGAGLPTAPFALIGAGEDDPARRSVCIRGPRDRQAGRRGRQPGHRSVERRRGCRQARPCGAGRRELRRRTVLRS